MSFFSVFSFGCISSRRIKVQFRYKENYLEGILQKSRIFDAILWFLRVIFPVEVRNRPQQEYYDSVALSNDVLKVRKNRRNFYKTRISYNNSKMVLDIKQNPNWADYFNT